jgi:molybdate transport system substrate-binding protein
MQWRDDTTLPSRGQSLRAIGKSRECFRRPLGVIHVIPAIVILVPGMIDDLMKQGKVAAGSNANAYVKEGQSGAAMARTIERLGIAAEMAPKTSLEARPEGAVESVVEGRADLGFNLISEILPVAGAELVGPLPAELQSYVVFTSGIGATSKDQATAKAFIDFLKGPAAVPVLKAKGMEPA